MAFKIVSITALLCSSILHIADTQQYCDYFDPCTSSQISDLPFPERRTVNCRYLNDQLCDDLITSTWYKLRRPLLTYCPRKYSCGALYPIWMNGSEPERNGDVVERNACLVMNTCCDKLFKVRMKRCSGFVAYCLPSTNGCPQRYCYDGNEKCSDHQGINATIPTDVTTSKKVQTIRKAKMDEVSILSHNGRFRCSIVDSIPYILLAAVSENFLVVILAIYIYKRCFMSRYQVEDIYEKDKQGQL